MSKYPETIKVIRIGNFPYISLKFKDFREAVNKSNPTIIYFGVVERQKSFIFIQDGIIISSEIPNHHGNFRQRAQRFSPSNG